MSILQETINKLEWEVKDLTDMTKQLQALVSIVEDCKLKFQQIKRKEASIAEFEKEEGSEDVVEALQSEKERCWDLLSKNKSRIEELDTIGKVKERPLNSVSDSEKLITFLKGEHQVVSAKREACTILRTSMEQQLKLDIIAQQEKKPHDEFVTKYSGEWIHTIPLSKFQGESSECKRLFVPHPHALPCARFLEPLYAQPDLRITHCELLHSALHLNTFHAALEKRVKRLGRGSFSEKLECEPDEEERRRVLDELVYKSPYLASHSAQDAGVLVMGAFHGTTADRAKTIIEVGFANLASNDEGWFGNGIYFTPNPEYAAMYCKGNPNPCLIFCYVILANPYPVVFSDASSMENRRFLEKANYRNYGCHFVPVVRYGDSDFRPPDPAKTMDGPVYNELVIFQEADILPHTIIYLESV
eukprot:Phypoly_transcript_07777.p1 GENE.Phypoly_transcript_07777~~Phypoly_transcript_07777.p1  ORF type:complete len:416 (+),score=62.88 Phypoly_transcript_07777:288-1535(+)